MLRPFQGGPMSPVWILKCLVSVFINAFHLLSALPSLSQFDRGRLSQVSISFYAVTTFWAMSLVEIYPGRASMLSEICWSFNKNYMHFVLQFSYVMMFEPYFKSRKRGNEVWIVKVTLSSRYLLTQGITLSID